MLGALTRIENALFPFLHFVSRGRQGRWGNDTSQSCWIRTHELDFRIRYEACEFSYKHVISDLPPYTYAVSLKFFSYDCEREQRCNNKSTVHDSSQSRVGRMECSRAFSSSFCGNKKNRRSRCSCAAAAYYLVDNRNRFLAKTPKLK